MNLLTTAFQCLIPITLIKKETQKAFLVECPSHRTLGGVRFWMSKSQAKPMRLGTYQYVMLKFNEPINGQRYKGPRIPPEEVTLTLEQLQDVFRITHEGVMMRLAFQQQAQQADVAFEQEWARLSNGGVIC